jgi:hypothetical protein
MKGGDPLIRKKFRLLALFEHSLLAWLRRVALERGKGLHHARRMLFLLNCIKDVWSPDLRKKNRMSPFFFYTETEQPPGGSTTRRRMRHARCDMRGMNWPHAARPGQLTDSFLRRALTTTTSCARPGCPSHMNSYT